MTTEEEYDKFLDDIEEAAKKHRSEPATIDRGILLSLVRYARNSGPVLSRILEVATNQSRLATERFQAQNIAPGPEFDFGFAQGSAQAWADIVRMLEAKGEWPND